MAQNDTSSYHIFLSYSRNDAELMREVEAVFRSEGLSVWTDEGIQPGTPLWDSAIETALKASGCMVVILTPNAMEAKGLRDEIHYANIHNIRIFPLLADGTEQTAIPYRLSGTQWVDIRAPNFERGMRKIVETVCAYIGIESKTQRVEREAHQAASSTPHRSQPISSQRKAPPYNRYFIGGVLGILVLVLVVGGIALLLSSIANNGSSNATLTPVGLPNATSTAAATQSGAQTPDDSATASFPASGNADLDAALARARTFTGTNAVWLPFYWTFDDGIEMALVPVGCFMMGSGDGEPDERPAHQQCFDEPFWIDRTEVTQGDFARLGGRQAQPTAFAGDERPIEPITWFEARDFCALRGARLPIEREWEYAARGAANWVYPWGDAWDTNNAVWNRSRSEGTANVGSIPAGASWVGALDMSGNVWEWTSSLYENYPYDADDGREADTGTRLEVRRVQRGGAWINEDAVDLRASNRREGSPGYLYNYNGIRCVRDVA